MWKNDNFFIGTLAALALSIVASFLIIFTAPWFYRMFSEFQPQNKIILLALVPSILLMRYYMRKLRFEKAGMGTVAVTFLFVILYFLFLDGKPVNIFFLNV
ncbi:MAG: hypothetical protein CVU14_08915 [Bacteroidetes bacterium HGW-Bacteroidetes-9]|jgi:chromate transport protein ChrA|nr:MAG: hypothetical protein CVU14_08915 [Bacteroidetes bacterium HGW-Bacteroidetes-9]